MHKTKEELWADIVRGTAPSVAASGTLSEEIADSPIDTMPTDTNHFGPQPIETIPITAMSKESIAEQESPKEMSCVVDANSVIEHADIGTYHNPKPLDPLSFPHQPRAGSSMLSSTIANFDHLMRMYDVLPQYDVIRKKLTITVPGQGGSPENADNVAITHVVSLATLNGLATGQTYSAIATIGDRNLVNPVANWILSTPWDGIDRLADFYATLTLRADYPWQLRDLLIYRWLLSAVAAAMSTEPFKARGVLTLQGPQSIGKTSWFSALIPDAILRDAVIKLDHHLDAGNKDSILTAVSHWIVEIGELDSSFRKDVARLKGFLTNDKDKLRRPYGRVDSEYPRRTVFCASVNDQSFLVDATGNTRWWTIPVTKVNYTHGIDMQQLFAQVYVS
jgi:hypothetical protein